MTEFDDIKNQIKADAKQCIIKGDKTPDECLDQALGKHSNLSQPDVDKIRKQLGDQRR